jgi:hypothetical protein
MHTAAMAALLTTIVAAPTIAFVSGTALAQSGPPSTNAPSLSETLQWLNGASEARTVMNITHSRTMVRIAL